eukprot:6036009-Amphidinium_carterae.1
MQIEQDKALGAIKEKGFEVTHHPEDFDAVFALESDLRPHPFHHRAIMDCCMPRGNAPEEFPDAWALVTVVKPVTEEVASRPKICLNAGICGVNLKTSHRRFATLLKYGARSSWRTGTVLLDANSPFIPQNNVLESHA